MADRKIYPAIKDGDVFGSLTVLGQAPKKGRQSRHICRCSCGKVSPVFSFSLKAGKSTSCGCSRRLMSAEAREKIGAANRRHGQCGTPEYQAWRSMLDRTLNPSSQCWDRYGGRGITVSDEWKNSFLAFYRDMGPKPSPRHSLDRVKNEDGYCAANCEWREYEDQNRNRRNTVWIDWRGQQITLAEACQISGTAYYNAHRRIFLFGWSAERALDAPIRKVKHRDRVQIRCGAASG